MIRVTQFVRRATFSIVLGATGLLLVSASFLIPSAHALTLDANRDCDNNAVIRCGALSTQELMQKYNNQADVQAIFRHFGISQQEMNRIGATAVAGIVDRNGNVTVGGKVVATNAMTAGRQPISGSNAINVGGTRFYTRSPSVSFQTQRLKAFVVMTNTNSNTTNNNNGGARANNNQNNGRFAFAILASCGNPVKAAPKQPVQPAKPKPQPAPTKPKAEKPKTLKPQPRPEIKAVPAPQQQQTQSQEQTTTVTNTVTVPPPAQPAPAPAPQPQPEKEVVVERVEVPAPVAAAPQQPAPAPAPVQEELPKTGMENVSGILGVAGVATLLGTVAHFIFTRRKIIH